jgi:hypothetical protein
MLWFYGHLETFVLGVFAFGIVLHFVRRHRERRRYVELRAAYEYAVQEARQSDGNPAAVVREAELHRAFLNSGMPGWFEGFGQVVGRSLKFCAVFALVAFFLRGPIVRGEEKYARRIVGSTAAGRGSQGKASTETTAR